MEEKCNSAAICFVSFLPDILDSKAEGRNKYLEMLLAVAEKFKRNPYRQVHSATLVGLYSSIEILSRVIQSRGRNVLRFEDNIRFC